MRKKTYWLLILTVALILAGCKGQDQTPTISNQPTSSPIPETTQTSVPPTATSLPPVGAFLASPDADQGLVEELKPYVSSWVRENGYRFQSLGNISAADLEGENYRFVIVLPPQPDLASLVQAAPGTDFLAVGFSNLVTQQNLSVIPSGRESFDQHGFIAGYMAAMITPDWRVGVISVRDDAQAQRAREAFTLGVKYFCGLCRPEYPPFYEYPLPAVLPQDASSSQWRASADVLVKKGVKTVYVVPGAGDQEMIQFLVESQAGVIADSRYYKTGYQDSWVASLEFDLLQAAKASWDGFVGGEVGQMIQVPLEISHVNPEFLSPGRLENVRSILEEVRGGWIKTTTE